MNVDNPSGGSESSASEQAAPVGPSPPDIPAEAAPRVLLIESSMLAEPRPADPRLDFEHGMSYGQPVTLGLILLLGAIFIGQLSTGALSSTEAVVASGALQREKVLEGEVWRFLSAVFLHGDMEHLVGNCAALYVLGVAAEHAYGPSRFLMVFLWTGLTGSALSCLLSEGPSVGASGAIFGLIGCLIVFFYRYRGRVYFRDNRLGSVLLLWMGYSVATGFLIPYIDNWGHIGGLLGGAAAAFVLTPLDRVLARSPGNSIQAGART